MRDDRDTADLTPFPASRAGWRAPILAALLFIIGIVSLVMPLILGLWGIR